MAAVVAVTPVLLVLGAGSNVGAALGRLFSKHGFKVALASRRTTEGPVPDGIFHVQVDLSQPETVSQAFEKVTSALGPPHVVVYNGMLSCRGSLIAPTYSSYLPASQTDLLPLQRRPIHPPLPPPRSNWPTHSPPSYATRPSTSQAL